VGRQTVGILHPGQMGSAMGAALRGAGTTVLWAAQGRSDETAHRADLADLAAVSTVADLARRCDVLISVCPPAAALEVARQVAAAGAEGLFVDANAIAPHTAEAVARAVAPAAFVDAAIIGPPPWRAGTTTVYLAGDRADEVHTLFDGTGVTTVTAGDRVGQASAVKVCFALQSKALPPTSALIAAAADHYGVAKVVRDALAIDDIDLDGQLGELAHRATSRAWRWDGEMTESAAALVAAGLPAGLPESAAEIYRRVSAAIDRDAEPSTDAWIAALTRQSPAGSGPLAGT
jgi:3-hydroxyisobutyrate dehydrogenase-like beta-hydroxyacid dehydrogenase